MNVAARRRAATRAIVLDRSLEALPFFRLSDSADDSAISYSPPGGGRWRVLPTPGDRLPGTFDQDIYVELLRRYHEAGFPSDGCVTFTLHAFLRAIGRRVDGRTYEQLRAGLARLNRTTAESSGAYLVAPENAPLEGSFTLLTAVSIDRRRMTDREQLSFFPALESAEPGEAKVTIAPIIRANIAAGHVATLSPSHYLALSSPVARRLYRLLEVARAEGQLTWRASLESLAEQLPLAQRFPSHLQRVLQPAHEMLLAAGIARDVRIKQVSREWVVDYVMAGRAGTHAAPDGTH
ncbi:MAG TPA: replication initiator protein A [Gemmatimonadaceae bacterium]|nr:replication initiator protein A [Gemmatimonadaceae bacterium]